MDTSNNLKIDVTANTSQAVKALGKLEKLVRRFNTTITDAVNDATKNNPKSISGNDMFQNAMSKANKQFDKEIRIKGQAMARQEKYTKKAITSIDEFTEKVANQGKILKKTQVPFSGYAMSLMFFGMALQRIFGTIRKSSTKAFQEVMHSVEGTTTGFDMLQGSLKYLGFSVGEALEPATEWLTKIVDKISTFAQANPGLMKGIIGWGSALGGLFAVGGAGVLAADGFVGLALKMGWFTKKAEGGILASQGFLKSFKALKIAAGAGLLIAVAFDIFGSDKIPTRGDYLKNLGMSIAGGWMVGGPWGALAAAAITMVIMVSKEDARRALANIKAFKEAANKILKSEAVNIKEASLIGWQGTVVPQYVQDSQQQKMDSFLKDSGYMSNSQYNMLYGDPTKDANNQSQQITLKLDYDFTSELFNGNKVMLDLNSNGVYN